MTAPPKDMPSWDAAPVASGFDVAADELAAAAVEAVALVVGLREFGTVKEPVGWTSEELPNG